MAKFSYKEWKDKYSHLPKDHYRDYLYDNDLNKKVRFYTNEWVGLVELHEIYKQHFIPFASGIGYRSKEVKQSEEITDLKKQLQELEEELKKQSDSNKQKEENWDKENADHKQKQAENVLRLAILRQQISNLETKLEEKPQVITRRVAVPVSLPEDREEISRLKRELAIAQRTITKLTTKKTAEIGTSTSYKTAWEAFWTRTKIEISGYVNYGSFLVEDRELVGIKQYKLSLEEYWTWKKNYSITQLSHHDPKEIVIKINELIEEEWKIANPFGDNEEWIRQTREALKDWLALYKSLPDSPLPTPPTSPVISPIKDEEIEITKEKEQERREDETKMLEEKRNELYWLVDKRLEYYRPQGIMDTEFEYEKYAREGYWDGALSYRQYIEKLTTDNFEELERNLLEPLTKLVIDWLIEVGDAERIADYEKAFILPYELVYYRVKRREINELKKKKLTLIEYLQSVEKDVSQYVSQFPTYPWQSRDETWTSYWARVGSDLKEFNQEDELRKGLDSMLKKLEPGQYASEDHKKNFNNIKEEFNKIVELEKKEEEKKTITEEDESLSLDLGTFDLITKAGFTSPKLEIIYLISAKEVVMGNWKFTCNYLAFEFKDDALQGAYAFDLWIKNIKKTSRAVKLGRELLIIYGKSGEDYKLSNIEILSDVDLSDVSSVDISLSDSEPSRTPTPEPYKIEQKEDKPKNIADYLRKLEKDVESYVLYNNLPWKKEGYHNYWSRISRDMRSYKPEIAPIREWLRKTNPQNKHVMAGVNKGDATKRFTNYIEREIKTIIKLIEVQPEQLSKANLNEIKFAPGSWLNDREIEWAYEQIKKDAPANRGFVDAFDFLLAGAQTEVKVDFNAKLFSEFNRKDKDIIFVPVGQPDTHWSLIVYIRKENKFYHLDSSRNKINKDHIEEFIQHFTLHMKAKFEEVVNIPLQPNAYDCGIYLLTYTKMLSRDPGSLKGLLPSIDPIDEREYWRNKIEPKDSQKDLAKEQPNLTENEWKGYLKEINNFFSEGQKSLDDIDDWLLVRQFPDPMEGIDLQGWDKDKLLNLPKDEGAREELAKGKGTAENWKQYEPLYCLGDGNCFFNAFSILLAGDTSLATRLRLRVCLGVMSRELTGNIASKDPREILREINDKMPGMSSDANWEAWRYLGDIAYVSAILKRPIRAVYRPDMSKWDKTKQAYQDAVNSGGILFVESTAKEKDSEKIKYDYNIWFTIYHVRGNHFVPLVLPLIDDKYDPRL